MSLLMPVFLDEYSQGQEATFGEMSRCGLGSKEPTAEGNPGNVADGAVSEMSLELHECPHHWRSASLSLEDSGRLSVFTLGSIFGVSRKQR